MRFTEIIAQSIAVYRKNLKSIAICILIVALPSTIAISLIPVDALIYTDLLTTNSISTLYENTEKMMTMLKYSAILQIINLFLVPIGTMAVAYIVKKSISGSVSSAKEAMESAFSSWGKLIATSVIMVVLVFAGLMLFMVPGLIIMVYVTFYTYAIVLDGQWGIGALRRSFEKVRGRWWKTLFYVLLLSAFSLGIAEVFAMISTAFARVALFLLPSENAAYIAMWIGSIIIQIASQVFSSFLLCAYTIWYLSIPSPGLDNKENFKV